MAKSFNILRAKMSPEARHLAELKTKALLEEIRLYEALKITPNKKVPDSDENFTDS